MILIVAGDSSAILTCVELASMSTVTLRPMAVGSLVLIVLIAIAACGGGDGGVLDNGSGGAGYSVGGVVTGLSGSGLVLQDNGGNSLPVSADGPFTFANKVTSGTAYTVTVYAQPTNPAQTCVITNASGTMASGSVGTVMVACPPILQGKYTLVEFDYDPTGDLASLGNLNFDGAGNFAGTLVRNAAGTISNSEVSGSYSLAADGTISLSLAGGPPMTGSLNADGSTLVAVQTTNDLLPGVLIGIKQGQSNFSNASLNGVYTTVEYDYAGTGDISHLASVAFDGRQLQRHPD